MPLNNASWNTARWNYFDNSPDGVPNYYRGYDIHVVRNNRWTGDIRSALIVDTSNGQQTLLTYMTTGGGDGSVPVPNITIRPSTRDGNNTAWNHPTAPTLYTFYDVEFDATNCRIRAKPYTGSGADLHKINFNFHVEVAIVDTSRPLGSQTVRKYFRVHVHNSISSVWLEPKILTVRQFTSAPPAVAPSRFSIYAQFSDGLVGDISCHPGITWTSNNGSVVMQDTPAFAADGRIAASTPGNYTVQAIIGAAAAINNNNATTPINSVAGNLVVKAAWNIQNNMTYNVEPLLVGEPNPLNYNAGDALNFLFISDGFQANDIEKFRSITDTATVYLKTNPTAEPFGILSKKRINYWRLPLPSQPGEGPSCLDEVIPFEKFKEDQVAGADYNPNYDINTMATGPFSFVTTYANSPGKFDVQTMNIDDYVDTCDSFLLGDTVSPKFEHKIDPSAHPKHDKKKRQATLNAAQKLLPAPTIAKPGLLLSRFIAKVGFPTPQDVSVSLAAMITKWVELYDKNFLANMVPQYTYDCWIWMSRRCLYCERDSDIGLATGDKPQMADVLGVFPRSRHFGLHPFRNDRTSLDPMLGELWYTDPIRSLPTHDDRLGNLWRTVAVPSLPLPAPQSPLVHPARAKSSAFFIAFISAGTRYAGSNTRDVSGGCVAVSVSDKTPISFDPNLGALPFPKIVPYGLQLDLQKSYLPVGQVGVVAHEFAHSFRLGDEYGDANADLRFDIPHWQVAANSLNIMRDFDARGGSFTNPISGDNLRWRWLRIKAAAEIVSAITSTISGSNTIYQFNIRSYLMSPEFALNNKVRFRTRILPTTPPATGGPGAQLIGNFSAEGVVVAHAPATGPGVVDVETVSVSIPTASAFALGVFNMNDLLVKLIESEYEGVGKITGTSGGNKLTGTGMITGFQFRPGYKVRLETSNNVWPVTAFGANDITITAGGGNPAFPSISGETKFYVRPSNDFLELVHDSIRIRMNSVNSAFTDIVNNLPAHLGNGKQDPDNSNFASYLGFFDKPANIYQAVGLYHGAEGYVSGGYHPTGTCMMRSSSADNDTAGDTVRGFCPVCRFAIVDIVDPTCHRANDAYIDLIYPKFK